MAGIEVGGCLVSSSDGLWETRHGPIVSNTQRTQLCVDVHQVRPDPFDANRYVSPSTLLRNSTTIQALLGVTCFASQCSAVQYPGLNCDSRMSFMSVLKNLL